MQPLPPPTPTKNIEFGISNGAFWQKIGPVNTGPTGPVATATCYTAMCDISLQQELSVILYIASA